MLKTYKAKHEGGGRIQLTEPADLPPNAEVFVTIVEDEDQIGGIPITMLLSEKSLGEYWNRPEEDEAWKDYQDEAK